MRRYTLVFGIVIASLGLIMLPWAVAANPQVNHFEFSGTFTDDDFCGTGKTVEGSFAGHGTEFLAPNQPVDYRNTTEGNNFITNPLNGKTVIIHFAGPFSDKVISGDPVGIHTHEFTNIGLPELIRLKNGPVLSRDAGVIVFHTTFNGDVFISQEIVVNKGPHPEAEGDFELFCDIIPGALGL